MAQAAAVCGIPISPTETCGVQAIGRCVYCNRAFCRSHQARTQFGINAGAEYVDVCAPCWPKTAEGQRRQKEQEMWAAKEYFESDAARTALLSSEVPPVEIYQVEKGRGEYKKGLFGRGEWVALPDAVTLIGHGWILGEFMWSGNDGGAYGGTNFNRKFLTALRDMAGQDSSAVYGERVGKAGFVRVRPYPGGYEVLKGIGEHLSVDWLEVMQAVKRLIGESS